MKKQKIISEEQQLENQLLAIIDTHPKSPQTVQAFFTALNQLEQSVPHQSPIYQNVYWRMLTHRSNIGPSDQPQHIEQARKKVFLLTHCTMKKIFNPLQLLLQLDDIVTITTTDKEYDAELKIFARIVLNSLPPSMHKLVPKILPDNHLINQCCPTRTKLLSTRTSPEREAPLIHPDINTDILAGKIPRHIIEDILQHDIKEINKHSSLRDYQFKTLQIILRYDPSKFRLFLENPELITSIRNINYLLLFSTGCLKFLLRTCVDCKGRFKFPESNDLHPNIFRIERVKDIMRKQDIDKINPVLIDAYQDLMSSSISVKHKYYNVFKIVGKYRVHRREELWGLLSSLLSSYSMLGEQYVTRLSKSYCYSKGLNWFWKYPTIADILFAHLPAEARVKNYFDQLDQIEQIEPLVIKLLSEHTNAKNYSIEQLASLKISQYNHDLVRIIWYSASFATFLKLYETTTSPSAGCWLKLLCSLNPTTLLSIIKDTKLVPEKLMDITKQHFPFLLLPFSQKTLSVITPNKMGAENTRIFNKFIFQLLDADNTHLVRWMTQLIDQFIDDHGSIVKLIPYCSKLMASPSFKDLLLISYHIPLFNMSITFEELTQLAYTWKETDVYGQQITTEVQPYNQLSCLALLIRHEQPIYTSLFSNNQSQRFFHSAVLAFEDGELQGRPTSPILADLYPHRMGESTQRDFRR